MDPLGPDELAQRLKAARTLRGLDQVALGDRFKEDGLGRMDPGRIERGEMQMLRSHRDAFCRHLRIPDWWLTSHDVDVVVGLRPPPRLTPDPRRHTPLERRKVCARSGLLAALSIATLSADCECRFPRWGRRQSETPARPGGGFFVLEPDREDQK